MFVGFFVKSYRDSEYDKSKQFIPDKLDSAYKQSVSDIEDINMAIKKYCMSHSSDDYMRIYNLSEDLSYEYKDSDISSEERHKYIKQKHIVDS